MLNYLQKINELVSELPSKDIEHAKRFIKAKDWESLKELTWSSLIKLDKAFKNNTLLQKYPNIDIDKVRELSLLCNEYYSIIYQDDENSFEDTYDNEVEENF